ncbi:MAG: glycerophosphodiester phosphodiesterase family protein [Methylocystis sp.]
MSSPLMDCMLERPIAHRGLHDLCNGIIENSISAALCAIQSHYAIECDIQKTREGNYVVFHDDTLDRLTTHTGAISQYTLQDLQKIPLLTTQDTIPSLHLFLETIGGRTPLFIEIKSDFSDCVEFPHEIARTLSQYQGPIALESFDPRVIAYIRHHAKNLALSHIPLGIIAQENYSEKEWPMLSRDLNESMTHFLHFDETQPDFISWRYTDLPHAIPNLFKTALHKPVTSWTIRSLQAEKKTLKWVDQIVFEGYRPKN